MLEITSPALTPVADYFKVLSQVSRLQILCVLQSGEKNVTEIIEATGMGQANVSKHLMVLTQAGIVTRQPKGANVFYQITDPIVFELCELVCDRLKIQLHEQSQKLSQLTAMRYF